MPLSAERTVAIVGTREATPYGVRIASELATAFARAGVTVVSGLARGVDAAAHRGAMAANGPTVAVMGTGADVPYPAAHRSLHTDIQKHGLVLSEMEPGTTALPGCFPRRNRIIAALASVTIVVEAPFKSGAINTATQALDLGRTVAAVPGPIDSPRSAGSNQLLRDGAQFVGGIGDALGLFGLSEHELSNPATLGDRESQLLSVLKERSESVDGLCALLGWTAREVMATLGLLELHGLVATGADGFARPCRLPLSSAVNSR